MIYAKGTKIAEVPAEKLMPNTVPKKPWSHIMADFITKLPLAQGYGAILVVYNRIMKIAHFVPSFDYDKKL